jgi:hypothetical protein
MLLICWSTVIAFRRERRVYDRAQRAQLVDYVGEHYGSTSNAATSRACGCRDGGAARPPR